MAAAKNQPGDLDLRPFVEKIGVKKYLEPIETEEMIQSAGPKKVVETLGVERYVANLSPEDRQRLKDLLQ